MDLKSYSRWFDYSRARDEMFRATDTSWAPWYVVHSDDKRRARLNALTHILSKIPYEELPSVTRMATFSPCRVSSAIFTTFFIRGEIMR
jgi:hypothetical protein